MISMYKYCNQYRIGFMYNRNFHINKKSRTKLKSHSTPIEGLINHIIEEPISSQDWADRSYYDFLVGFFNSLKEESSPNYRRRLINSNKKYIEPFKFAADGIYSIRERSK